MKFSIVTACPMDGGLGLRESLRPLCDDLPDSYEIVKFLMKIEKSLDKVILVAWNDELIRVIGTATLIIEEKIIHNFGKVIRIEDVSVDENFQGQGVGKALINKCIEIAKICNPYKILLDCNLKNKSFYEQFGFKEAGISMRMDIDV